MEGWVAGEICSDGASRNGDVAVCVAQFPPGQLAVFIGEPAFGPLLEIRLAPFLAGGRTQLRRRPVLEHHVVDPQLTDGVALADKLDKDGLPASSAERYGFPFRTVHREFGLAVCR